VTARRRMTVARKVRIFDAAKGICHLCQRPIAVGEAWEAEHIIALTCGGTDDDTNLAPAHIDCHKVKTKADKGTGAKLTRQRAAQIGATPVTPKAIIPAPPKPPPKQRRFDRTPLPQRNPFTREVMR